MALFAPRCLPAGVARTLTVAPAAMTSGTYQECLGNLCSITHLSGLFNGSADVGGNYVCSMVIDSGPEGVESLVGDSIAYEIMRSGLFYQEGACVQSLLKMSIGDGWHSTDVGPIAPGSGKCNLSPIPFSAKIGRMDCSEGANRNGLSIQGVCSHAQSYPLLLPLGT